MLIAAALISVATGANPEELVNTFWGTVGQPDYSRGNLVPMVTTPWAFNGWAPETVPDKGSWWWNHMKRTFYGIRCTHRPSPWMGDWGYFTFFPMMTVPGHETDGGQYSSYNPQKSTWKPYHFKTELETYTTKQQATQIEVTSTGHASITRVVYPPFNPNTPFVQTRQLEFFLDSGSLTITPPSGRSPMRITGQATNGGVTMHIVIEIETDATYKSKGEFYASNRGQCWYALFHTDGQTFNVRSATSLISAAQAEVNLKQVSGRSFEDVMAASKAEWNSLLSVITVNDNGNQPASSLEVLYSNFYRAAQFPRFLTETNSTGHEVHFSTYAGSGVYDGPLVTDSGFWDSYRTVYPFLSVVRPDILGKMVQGWVNSFKEGGWLPKWASPGYRTGMVATMGDVVLADAIVLDIPGFDKEKAYEAIRKDAFVPPSSTGQGSEGREALREYMEKGYVPNGNREDVSVSLNFMLADYAIANAAEKLNKTEDVGTLRQRASGYDKLFLDGFFRSKTSSGSFVPSFDQFLWGGSYTEAGPWQYRFYVPHDPKGLQALYKKNGLDLCDTLQKAQTIIGAYHNQNYGGTIHEMTEMRQDAWGQYEHNNQPSHYMLYMFGAIDETVSGNCSRRGQYWLRKAVRELYLPSPAMYAGDEDNGEMAAWHILSALGLYSLAPSSGSYQLGIPLWKSVTLTFPNGKKLHVETDEPTAAPGTPMYVKNVSFNGNPVNGTTLPYKTFMQGGVLKFSLTQ